MTRLRFPDKILIYEAIGFLVILAFTVADTIFGFPRQYLIPHTVHHKVWEASIEAIGILTIALITLMMTHQLLSRLLYLESFLTVCGGCMKVNHNGKWIPAVDYLRSGFSTRTTHRLCPECSKKTMQDFPM